MMHLVLLDAQQHFESRLRSRRHSGGHGDALAQKLIRETLQEARETLAPILQAFKNLSLGMRLFLRFQHWQEKFGEVEAFKRRQLLALDMLLYPRRQRDVQQRFGDAARLRRGAKYVMLLVDLFRNRNRVFADGPKACRKFFSSVIVHESYSIAACGAGEFSWRASSARRRATSAETSHSAPATATIAIAQCSTVTRNAGVHSGHSILNLRKVSQRSIIQCQPVCATRADKIMVPIRSATA